MKQINDTTTSIIMSNGDGNIRMRSASAATFPSGAEAQIGAHEAGERPDESSNDAGAPDPLQLPPSTHSLLFTRPVRSLPFAFATGIVVLTYACLALVFANNLDPANGPHDNFIPDLPANVSPTVRVAQYLSIFIVLLMEEEIPTGLYLLRMIPRATFREQFPDLKYSRFVFSSWLRICMGEFFLFNVFIVLAQATEVISIFYDVLALQFIQQLDDIVFALAKMDVLGKEMQRACTAKCFQTEFERRKSGRSKKLSIFLKAQYFLNFGILVGGMMTVSVKQEVGDYHPNSINVDFGDVVWEEALVKMPAKFHEEWVSFLPFFDGVVTPDAYEKWTLVYSYFNGVYKRDRNLKNGTRAGRPVYREMSKFIDTAPLLILVPAEIYYCEGIRAWVFTHDFIRKSKETDESGCNWLLRSEETDEYDLMKVGMTWKIWHGVIGNTEISYANTKCSDNTDCNLNGNCTDGECHCSTKDGVEYLGTHCEISLKDECETIISERDNVTFSVGRYNSAGNPNGTLDTPVQQYSRPVYYYIGGIPGFVEGDVFQLQYTGNTWFGVRFSVTELNLPPDYNSKYAAAIYVDSHGFWTRTYDPLFTKVVSDATKKDTPVGVDFYTRGEEGRGGQFGPFGALYPLQLYNQTGRGYFRCGGTISSLGNMSGAGRKL